MREIARDIACAVIISGDSRILMGRKHPGGGGVFVNCWQIPGGGIEPGESQIQALSREIREEVGISIQGLEVSLLSDKDSGSAVKRLSSGEEVLCHMKFFVYLIHLPGLSGDIETIAGDDFAEISWFTQSELSEIKLVPAGERLFAEFGDRIFGSPPS